LREHFKTHQDEYRARAKRWAEKYPMKNRQYGARWRARKLGVELTQVDYDAIIERDKGVCHICNLPINPGELHFDHVIPLTKGGSHTRENIAMAHAFCNLSKNNKIMP